MPRMIDQIRASKLPSNMMQFAARGALQVSPAENIEILVYLALHNKVFGDLAKMTLAGWDEKASIASASDPQTPREVLEYMISPDNMRPKVLPSLLENPSVPEEKIAKLAVSASQETIGIMLKSRRVQGAKSVLKVLVSNPYARKEEVADINKLLTGAGASAQVAPAAAAAVPSPAAAPAQPPVPAANPTNAPAALAVAAAASAESTAQEAAAADPEGGDVPDEAISAYLSEHAGEIAAEGNKPFQAIGGLAELLGNDYFPVSRVQDVQDGQETAATAPAPETAAPVAAAAKPAAPADGKRENTVQKVNRLDVKGRIQLALKGNKEERSLLIRDGTKVVALAVLEAPKLSDGEVEKFASQKNVLEAVLRQIPLKRRFMKNYIVVRNLCANPRTPLDLGLSLMKNLLPADLKNISGNKDVSETIRKLALKMYKQKMEAANKK